MPFFTNRGITPLAGGGGGGGLLLDLITPQPTLAVGTRRLRTAYSGSALTISTVAGVGPQDIGFSSDEIDVAAIVAYDSGSGGGVGNNSWVKQYWDQSTGANHLTISGGTAANIVRETSVSSTVNGYIAPNTDLGAPFTKSGLVLSSVVSASAFTVLAAVNAVSFPASSDAYHVNLVSDPSSYLSIKIASRSSSNIFGTNVYDGADKEANKACTTGAHVLVTKLGSGTLSSWVDGGTPATVSSGNIQNVAGAFQFTDSEIKIRLLEALVYNVALSSADINTLAANMATRAGTSWTPV